MSPTYPGTYPNILNCTYKFIGQPNERVSIHFEEVLLHFGADQYVFFLLLLLIVSYYFYFKFKVVHMIHLKYLIIKKVMKTRQFI